MRLRGNFAILLVLACAECAPNIATTVSYRAPTFESTRQRFKHLGLLFVDEGRKRAYTRTFSSVYGSDEEFGRALRRKIIEALGIQEIQTTTLDVRAEDLADMSATFPIYTGDASAAERARVLVARLSSEHDLDAVMLVRRWEISEEYFDSTSDWGDHEHGHHSSSTRTFICVVSIEGGVLDAEGTLLSYGEVEGRYNRIYFFFETALRKAVDGAATGYADMIAGTLGAKDPPP